VQSYIFYILIVWHTFSPESPHREYSGDSENGRTSGDEGRIVYAKEDDSDKYIGLQEIAKIKELLNEVEESEPYAAPKDNVTNSMTLRTRFLLEDALLATTQDDFMWVVH